MLFGVICIIFGILYIIIKSTTLPRFLITGTQIRLGYLIIIFGLIMFISFYLKHLSFPDRINGEPHRIEGEQLPKVAGQGKNISMRPQATHSKQQEEGIKALIKREIEAYIANKKPIENSKTQQYGDRISYLINQEIDNFIVGNIMFNSPSLMTEDVSERVEVRISKDLGQTMISNLKGKGIPQIEKIRIGNIMKAKLFGDTFSILSLSEDEQPIPSSGFAQWEWDVIPQLAGKRKLHLIVSITILIEGYKDINKSLPVLEKEVEVIVNKNRKMEINWNSLIIIVTSIASAIGALFVIMAYFKSANKKRKSKIK